MSRKPKAEQNNKLNVGFSGFDRPEANWFRMPNKWTDITADIDNLAELKVVEYILRHTWGYQEYDIKKHITIDEFVNGRRRQDGQRIDKGTGLSERGVRYGLQKAVGKGLIEEAIDNSDRGRVKKYYSLRMRSVAESEDIGEPEVQGMQSGVQTLHPGVQDLPLRGANDTPRTEKETKERHLRERNTISNIQKESPLSEKNKEEEIKLVPRPDAGIPQRHTPNASTSVTTNSSTPNPTPDHPRSEDQKTEPSKGLEAVGSIIKRARPTQSKSVQSGHQSRQPYNEDRQVILEFVEDFGREFGDRATLKSSTTRAFNLYQQANLPIGAFISKMHEARSITKESAARIRPRAGDQGSEQGVKQGTPTKKKMAYFFSVLEDRLGFRDRKDDTDPIRNVQKSS